MVNIGYPTSCHLPLKKALESFVVESLFLQFTWVTPRADIFV